MVKVPARPEKTFDDAGDFRDPYFPVRGFQELLGKGPAHRALRWMVCSFFPTPVPKNSWKIITAIPIFLWKKFLASRSGKSIPFRDACVVTRESRKSAKTINSNALKCHGGNRRAKSLASAHKDMVPNPSDLEHAGKYCGKCHADQIEKVEQSAMASAKGMINITRYAWGAQPYGKINYSLRPNAKNTMEAPFPPENKKHAVDSFLQTKCLRCHLQAPAPHRPGEYRATGCAACHMVYGNDGLTMSQDRAIQSKKQNPFQENKTIFQRGNASHSLTNKRGYPVVHKFTSAIPSVQCEHCHNDNGIGNEFEGLLRKPPRPIAAKSRTDLRNAPALWQ